MPIDTSMYPKPAAPTNPLDLISKLGGVQDSLGKIAVGQGMQDALDPETGNIDQNKLLSTLKQSPAGAAQAVPTLDALAKLKQAGFAADAAGLETFQKRMATTYHLFSGLASKPNPTMKDVYDTAAMALDPSLEGAKHGITLPVIMNAVKGFNGLSPAEIRKKALEIQSMAASTSEILQQHSPKYEWVNQGGQMTMVPTGTGANPATGTAVPMQQGPNTVVATPGGNKYLGEQPAVPGGGAVGPDGQPIVEGMSRGGRMGAPTATGPAQSQPPGFSEAATAIGSQSGASANALTQANDSSMTRKAMLGNLEEDLRHFTSGPGADYTRLAKAWVNRNVPVPKSWQESGAVLDPKSIASQEQFNKQAGMLAQQQFATIGGTGTDAKFNSAFTTNPGETLTQMGNQGIMRLLKGNEDAIQTKAKEWQKWRKEGNGPETYPDFSADFNEKFDPRVFQFKYIDPKERQGYVDNMTDEEKSRFLKDLTYARKRNWISFEQPKAK